MPKIIFIAVPDFRDKELFAPKDILDSAEFETFIASTETGTIQGADKGFADADITISEIDASVYDGIVVVGGPGMYDVLYNNEELTAQIGEKVRAFNDAGKLVAAICVGPIALVRADIVNGRKISCWDDKKGTQKNEIKDAGGIFSATPVTKDGNFITASGPAAAEEFGNAIVEYFNKSV